MSSKPAGTGADFKSILSNPEQTVPQKSGADLRNMQSMPPVTHGKTGVIRPPQMNSKAALPLYGSAAGRKPVIFYEKYNTSDSWALDLFSLTHNGVRREISDLYDSLSGMNRLGIDLTNKDVDAFYSWWRIFREFVEAVFDMEESVIYPWITIVDPLTADNVSNKSRIQNKQDIFKVLQEIDTQRSATLTASATPKARIAQLPASIDKLSKGLLGYFQKVEYTLPQIIMKHYNPKEKEKIDKRICDFIRKSIHDEREFFVLQTCWMKEEDIQQWALANLTFGERQSFTKWRADIDESHFQVVAQLLKKSGLPRMLPSPPIDKEALLGQAVRKTAPPTSPGGKPASKSLGSSFFGKKKSMSNAGKKK